MEIKSFVRIMGEAGINRTRISYTGSLCLNLKINPKWACKAEINGYRLRGKVTFKDQGLLGKDGSNFIPVST